MVRRISGKYKANTVSHLKSNNNTDITNVKEICNTLAEQFALILHNDDYSRRFNRYRLTVEGRRINFDTNYHYSNIHVFALHECSKQSKYHMIHLQVVIQFTIDNSSIFYLMTVCYYFCIF